jgi:LPS-assembly protein
VLRRFIFAFGLVTALCRGGEEPVSQPTIKGDLQTIDFETGEAVLKGNVRLADTGLLLLADDLRYNNKTETATAVGHIVFTRGAMRLLADRIVYHRADESFLAENVRLGSYPYFAEAFTAEGSRTEIILKRSRISYGEPGPWQITWNADRVIYTADGRLRSDNSRFGIGHAQPVPFPKFQQKLGEPFAGAASLTGGFRRSLGLFVDAEFLVPVNPTLRAGADVGLFTSRGLMAGPALRYADPDDAGLLHGFFRSGYINDRGDRKTDLLGRPVPADRAFVAWEHQQTLTENLTLAAQLNWWKDSEVLRDFRPRAFFPVQEPDTSVESVYTGANYFVSAFARFQPNRFHHVQQRLPELRFDLLPTAVGGGFYERFNASAAVLREDPLPGDFAPKYRSDRLDAYYAVERPITPTDWFAFTPIAGARVTHYANAHESAGSIAIDPALLPVSSLLPAGQDIRLGNYTRTLGEVGFDAALRTSGTFAFQNEQWKIDGLRHLFTPRLSYRYIPEADKGRAHIPAIDRQSFSTYLQPLGLGDIRNIDDLHATNTLRLGFDNILQTRDAATGTRDLLVFNVANDFRFKRQRGERDVSEIHTDMSLTPARWVQVDLYQSFRPQTFAVREFNSALTLRDGNIWTMRFSNSFLRGQIEDYVVDGRVRLTEAYEAVARLHYDARRHRFNEQAYGITQNLGNTWLISYTVSLYSGRRRESSFGFNVQIDTVRF